MEKFDIKEIKKTWSEKGKDLTPPSVYMAYDKNYRFFYIIQDKSTIIYIILSGSNTTFCIPKKYCKIEKDKNNQEVYKILDNSKLIVVSCPSSNKYELFVQKYLMK